MAMLRLTMKAALCAFVALMMAAVWAQPAHAWTWATRVTVYNNAGLCVQGTAGIDHRRPGAFSGNLAYADTYALNQGSCSTGLARPDGWAAARATVYRWNGSAWDVCRTSPWKYGATGQAGGEFPGPWGPEQVYDWGGWQSCGTGYYGTIASAYVWDGSAWRGGDVWSGYEFASPTSLRDNRPSEPGTAPTPPSSRPPVEAGAR
ncbi:hypothetical protein [Streptomyces sp. AK04-3B]|uniref:hypothetical protein n=1 Tax=unclassified Streptomyces TaxID=2593676 RepID=UPI0029ADAE6B|nr:hypothetical protein [Streptomyces sp. AK04-3B]MDX3800201.1 hypothetical protein [Streptomyces sp. AK04-3B]